VRLARRVALLIALAVATNAPLEGRRSGQLAFRAGVDLIAVDVQVVTSTGLPVTGLGPDRFEVSINGRRRRVVSAEMVRYEAATPTTSSAAGPTPGDGVVQATPEGRVYVIAIDVLSFLPEATRLVAGAAREFIQKLQPSDLVGLAEFPGGAGVDPTTDHTSVINRLDSILGRGEAPVAVSNRFGLTPSNVVDITAAMQRDGWRADADPQTALGKAIEAVCSYDRDPDYCRQFVGSDALMLAIYDEGLAVQRLGALRGLLAALARSAGRKTVVLVSAGLPGTDVSGGRPELGDLGLLVGQEAARANSTIYSVHVDTRRTQASSASSGGRARPTDNQQRDSAILSRPLDHIAGLSGGTLFTIVQGGGEPAFDRIRNETSALYLLGVEPDQSDRTGAPRRLNVKVSNSPRGATVRARSWVVVPKPGAEPLEARTTTSPAAPPPSTGTAAALAPPAPSASIPPPSPRAPTAFDALYDEYAAGRTTVILDRLRTREDFERYRPDMVATLAEWRKTWSPRRAAFALDIALTAYARHWPNPDAFLRAARDIVTSRPDPPGIRADEDQFEALFHRTVVAFLAILDRPQSVDAYLTSIQTRVNLTAAPSKGVMLTDPRLVLAHAMAREVQTLPLLLSTGSQRQEPRSWAVGNDNKMRSELEAVGELYAASSAYYGTRPEALVRHAFVLHRLGTNDRALALLEASTPSDPMVDYWRALIRGRVLEALGRTRDAVASFERAAELAPGAQTPAVALSTLFLTLGDRETAFSWAARARSTTEDQSDPWPRYWTGHSRFLSEWLDEVRQARP
jgi:VWFA-related protein